jgi:beta-glucosidase
MGIRPLVTIHHFSNPVWVADPRGLACSGGPTDTNLCGLGSPGGPQVIQQMADHAALLAQRFGDLVDEWGTVNEPVNYLLAAYGIGVFPPGGVSLTHLDQLTPVFRDYIAAHAAMYHAIKANDTVDADGDGIAASVGLSLSVADWEPTRANMPSTNPDDLAARDRLVYVFHYLFADAVTAGMFDSNFDGVPDESHPEWANTLDWLGLQYYMRSGVSADRPFLPPPVSLTPCFSGIDVGSCRPAPDPTYCVPRMGYEGWTDGIRDILHAFADRYPGVPLVVTEAGIATDTGARRAETSCACWSRWRALATKASTCAATTTGASRTTSSGPKASVRTSAFTAWTTRPTTARRPKASTSTPRSRARERSRPRSASSTAAPVR